MAHDELRWVGIVAHQTGEKPHINTQIEPFSQADAPTTLTRCGPTIQISS